MKLKRRLSGILKPYGCSRTLVKRVIAVTFGTASQALRGTRSKSFGLGDRRLSRFYNTLTARKLLTTQAKTADDLVIALYVRALEVVQQTPALRDHLEQAAPRVVVLGFEMLGQLVDALAEQSDLHLRRTRIAVVRPKLIDDSFLCLFC